MKITDAFLAEHALSYARFDDLAQTPLSTDADHIEAMAGLPRGVWR